MKSVKRWKFGSLGLAFLSLMISLWAIPFLPAKIPAHYNFKGEITRWGTSQELLIMPLITLLSWPIFLFIYHLVSKKEKEKAGIALLKMAALCITLFTFLNIAMVLDALKSAGVPWLSSFHSSNFFFLSFGIFLLFCSKLLPGLERNSTMGVRTPWTLASDQQWLMGQRIGQKWFRIWGIALFCLSFYPHQGVLFGLFFLSLIFTLGGLLLDLRKAKKESHD